MAHSCSDSGFPDLGCRVGMGVFQGILSALSSGTIPALPLQVLVPPFLGMGGISLRYWQSTPQSPSRAAQAEVKSPFQRSGKKMGELKWCSEVLRTAANRP